MKWNKENQVGSKFNLYEEERELSSTYCHPYHDKLLNHIVLPLFSKSLNEFEWVWMSLTVFWPFSTDVERVQKG